MHLLFAAISVICFKLFGIIPTFLGMLAYFITTTFLIKEPSEKWSDVVGIIVGIIVAVAANFAFVVFLSR